MRIPRHVAALTRSEAQECKPAVQVQVTSNSPLNRPRPLVLAERVLAFQNYAATVPAQGPRDPWGLEVQAARQRGEEVGVQQTRSENSVQGVWASGFRDLV